MSAWCPPMSTMQAEMDWDLFMAWMRSVKKETLDGWPIYRFSDGGYIGVSETFDVLIGNTEDSFDSLLDAAWHLWTNHSKDNVL